MTLSRLDFAGVFAKFGWNPVELERVVDLFFGFAGNAGVVIKAVEPVLVESQTHLQGTLPQGDAVTL